MAATDPALTEAQQLVASLNQISRPAPGISSRHSPRETRLDAAFDRYIARLAENRPGWCPRWTADLRAVHWAGFAHECKSMMLASGVPTPDQKFDLEEIPTWLPEGYRKLAAELLKLIDEPKTLAIIGPRGTGKSTLVYGLILKFCGLGRPALYRTAAEMFHDLTDAPWEQKAKVRTVWFNADPLVIDEVQVRDDRAWQDNELTTIVDRRHREDKTTLLVSNLEANELKENLGDSIWRRLIETGGPPINTKSWGRIEEIKKCRENAVKAARGGNHVEQALAV